MSRLQTARLSSQPTADCSFDAPSPFHQPQCAALRYFFHKVNKCSKGRRDFLVAGIDQVHVDRRGHPLGEKMNQAPRFDFRATQVAGNNSQPGAVHHEPVNRQRFIDHDARLNHDILRVCVLDKSPMPRPAISPWHLYRVVIRYVAQATRRTPSVQIRRSGAQVSLDTAEGNASQVGVGQRSEPDRHIDAIRQRIP